MKYVSFLELLVLFLLCILWTNFLLDHYYCTIDYDLVDVNISLNYSVKDVFYSREETIFILDKNKDLVNYDLNVSCNYYLKKK